MHAHVDSGDCRMHDGGCFVHVSWRIPGAGGHILCVRSGSVSVIQYLMSHVLFVMSVHVSCRVCRVFRTCV